MLSTKLKEAAGNSADATLYVDDVFSTYLYTGNGSTQTITNGIDLAGKGGLVWIKSRSQGSTNYIGNNLLYGSATGYERMYSNTANAAGSGNVISVSSTGFTTEALAASSYNGDNFVSWTFRKAAKFFDVVTYTGTGSARTIAHSLGVAPGMVIVKRTDTTGDWQVYSNGLTSAAYSIQLNLTDAQASAPTVWNSTAPTSSVFSVGSDATVNASGGTYVAYLFAHDPSADGIIQCGSFTTDGSGNATVNLGWEPQYVMMKTANVAAYDWTVLDTMRGWAADNDTNQDKALNPNSAVAEVGQNWGYPTATGFYTRGWWANQTVIYMAIRRPNKPPTSGTQVYNAAAITATQATLPVTSIGFPPDLIINGVRSNANFGQQVTDRLRGVTKQVFTEYDSAENTTNGTALVSLDMSGFTLGSDTAGTGWNAYTGYTSVKWNFKRAPGFFDEVCYTGTGVATTQAHNLAAVPELMIIKNRSVGNTSWPVYSKTLTVNQYLILNSELSYATFNLWNATAPTSSVFSVATYDYVNASGNAYVAYLFATLAGISKVGSYTGNGTGQAIACGFSAGARFVLIKRTDSTGGWYTFDSARGLTSGSSPYLLLNSAAAEITGNNGVYASTGGFTLATSAAGLNASGGTYIFLAVA